MRSVIVGFLNSPFPPQHPEMWIAAILNGQDEAEAFLGELETRALNFNQRYSQRRAIVGDYDLTQDEIDQVDRVLDVAAQRLKEIDPEVIIPDVESDHRKTVTYRILNGHERGFWVDADADQVTVTLPRAKAEAAGS